MTIKQPQTTQSDQVKKRLRDNFTSPGSHRIIAGHWKCKRVVQAPFPFVGMEKKSQDLITIGARSLYVAND